MAQNHPHDLMDEPDYIEQPTDAEILAGNAKAEKASSDDSAKERAAEGVLMAEKDEERK